MTHWIAPAGPILALMVACAAPAEPGDAQSSEAATLRAEVMRTERAFARTMADRDQRAFAEFISPEAVFFSGPAPLRGKDAVVEWWARYFAGPYAPFSWEPAQVEVLASGTLALSSGPVRGRDGQPLGRFTSLWRLEPPGRWRIVFDKGEPACRCGLAQQQVQ